MVSSAGSFAILLVMASCTFSSPVAPAKTPAEDHEIVRRKAVPSRDLDARLWERMDAIDSEIQRLRAMLNFEDPNQRPVPDLP